MTQANRRERPKTDWRLIGGTLVAGAFAAAFGLALSFAFDTQSGDRNSLGATLEALITGADTPGAHIVSIPLLWLTRALAVAAFASAAIVVAATIRQNRRTMLAHRAQAQ